MAIASESHTGNGALSLTSFVAILTQTADAATAGRYTFDVRLGSATKPMNSAACTLTLKLVLFDGTNRWIAGEASVSRSALLADPAEHGVILPPGAFDVRIANGQTVTIYARTNNAGDTSVDTFVVPVRVMDADGNVIATLTSDAIVAIEAMLADDAIGSELKQAVIDKLIENLPDLDDLSLAAIAQAVEAEGTKLYEIYSKLPAAGALMHAAGAAVALTEAERNAAADALLDRTAIDGKTLREAVRIMAAVLAGKVSGAGSGEESFTGLDGATTRVVVTADAAGNRTAVDYS